MSRNQRVLKKRYAPRGRSNAGMENELTIGKQNMVSLVTDMFLPATGHSYQTVHLVGED